VKPLPAFGWKRLNHIKLLAKKFKSTDRQSLVSLKSETACDYLSLGVGLFSFLETHCAQESMSATSRWLIAA
jgi:hypothetical protein